MAREQAQSPSSHGDGKLLQWVEFYRKRLGWVVLPLRGRVPAVRWAQYREHPSRYDTDSEEWPARGLWDKANSVGVITELSGLIVVDIDVNEDDDPFAHLSDGLASLGHTGRITEGDIDYGLVRTRSRRRHVYFRRPEQLPDDISHIPNISRHVAEEIGVPLVEVKAQGNHCVPLPPSSSQAGAYEWIRLPYRTADGAMQSGLSEPPEWFWTLVRAAIAAEARRHEARRQAESSRASSEVSKATPGAKRMDETERALRYQAKLAAAPEGQRYDALTHLAGALCATGFATDAIHAALRTFAGRCDPPYPEAEMRSAIFPAVAKWVDVRATDNMAESRQRAAPDGEQSGPPGNVVDADISSTEVDLDEFPQTDTGNAELIVRLFGDRIRYDFDLERWHLWDGIRWRADRQDDVSLLAKAAARRRYEIADTASAGSESEAKARATQMKFARGSENETKIRAALSRASAERPVKTGGEDWDRDPLLLGVRNGTVDLRTGRARDSRIEDYITLIAVVDYDAQASCPRWLEFLDEVFDGDKELIAYIRRAVGYCLTGSVTAHCFFLCHGAGRNGKSVFLNVVGSLLGEYAAVTPFTTLEATHSYASSATPELADLRGKRFVSARETQEMRRLDEARVKMLTGGDPITARLLYRDLFTFMPQFKVWLAVNHKPVIKDTSEGMWSRVRFLPFTVSFKGREDHDLERKLMAERAGILNWAIQGAVEWAQNGLQDPEVVLTATREYRDESDVVGNFLEECTHAAANGKVSAKALYAAYRRWCDAYRETALKQKSFGARLTERGLERERSGAGMGYAGIGLQDGWKDG
ncbi:hypothetical protein HN371_29285 [Candidatus Poribacteria bacterium]|nr:hypothetical protein [Candidatus Poribacteria bacterium]MBT5533484.1 hypothetical protein [Candidatus Poribacteria bacterium]MBT5710126.1 hypothetical protein [Candidatus Poribacteria bacterium]MBT7100531.1 hypothetical protein [Candidatus Poribacteria bacterium]MBT7808901.1 hypothetical protein [Candidatus Poribacteria bacterium]